MARLLPHYLNSRITVVAAEPSAQACPEFLAQLHHRVSWAELLNTNDADNLTTFNLTCQESCLVQRESAFAKRIRQQ